MSYRNKTYVAFASEEIYLYRLMEAWRDNDKIDFDFFDAHDLYQAKDTSKPETIKARLRKRLVDTAKQVVLIGSSTAKKKGSDGSSFLAHEISVIMELDLPVVIANADGSQEAESKNVPSQLYGSDHYTMSVSLRPAIIKYALDDYVPAFKSSTKTGHYYYKQSVYNALGL
jgi:hypothetical protein